MICTTSRRRSRKIHTSRSFSSTTILYDEPMQFEDDVYEEPAPEYSSPRHNEIEDFLL